MIDIAERARRVEVEISGYSLNAQTTADYIDSLAQAVEITLGEMDRKDKETAVALKECAMSPHRFIGRMGESDEYVLAHSLLSLLRDQVKICIGMLEKIELVRFPADGREVVS